MIPLKRKEAFCALLRRNFREQKEPIFWTHLHLLGVIIRLLEGMGGLGSKDAISCTRRSPSFHSHNRATGMDLMRSRYSRIRDNYNSLMEVTEALQQAGLESSNLIVGIDFTKSNKWAGKHSFNGCCLHDTGASRNPYEQAINIIGRTLSPFDEDNLIPCFGFGDASTHDQHVFSFYPDERPCNGFQEALSRYREIVPHLRFSGPSSFAPIIEMAMNIVEQSGCQYHILLIIADGQVTRNENSESGQLSYQEQKTVEAIVKASEFPLSIILVGVGDGPWDMMKKYDDNIPERSFDNFQFVNFTEIMSQNVPQSRKESDFALAALMEIPSQYMATLSHGILGSSAAVSPKRTPRPPPYVSYAAAVSVSDTFRSAASAVSRNRICAVCLMNLRDMVFDCGHQTCYRCGPNFQACPICYRSITKRIRLL